MITNNELQAVKLSPTKQDFYQIWNELLEVSEKLSERWSPASTNEADPGIVLLKVLTALADKLNYKIDKNILEAFMPSATQREAMIKLCDMLGYSMKYYRSAVTPVTISFNGDPTPYADMQIKIDAFTSIKNSDDDINYVTLEPVSFGFKPNDELVQTVNAIEGELVDAESGEPITLGYLDDNKRYYLPETQIAENGIFVCNDVTFTKLWSPVDNLNTQPLKTKCYKFGFDSKTQAPYIQFPEDMDAIIGNGIYIKYIRTNGSNGNISARTLSVMTEPISWSDQKEQYSDEEQQMLFDVANFSVFNAYASKNGADCETLNQAYNSYKKTIGTFDTLITCRDYMNRIYRMTESDNDLTPLVSNVIVSDLRDDINRSVILCTFDEYGIRYSTQALSDSEGDLIEHFDLVLYPFKTYTGANTISDYKNSFKPSSENLNDIKAQLEKCKTISHVIQQPKDTDIVCIKNYLELSAKISTTYRINAVEESDILSNIYQAIYKEFNMRNIDFGEEIPFDAIYECIQNADTRIKNVALNEPRLYTNICLGDGSEMGITDTDCASIHNSLMLKNVLAGRIPLFDYDTSFSCKYDEASYGNFQEQYHNIGKMHSEAKLPLENFTLRENETVLFKRPNLKTELTYPAYVNYYLDLGSDGTEVPAVDAVAVKAENLTEEEFLHGEYYRAIPVRVEHGGFLIGKIPGSASYHKFLDQSDKVFDPNMDYYSLTNKGSDAILMTITKDSEYQLKPGEYLVINYTPGNNGESSAQPAPKNIYYTFPTIIRPNFNLVDSKAKSETKSFTKRGLEPSTFKNAITGESALGGSFTGGMYGLDVDQQIEIRKESRISLDSNIFVYWTRMNEKATEGTSKIKFEWDEDYDETTGKYMSYTLKDGEYFYITDRAKTDIAYYGNGTQLTRMPNTPELIKEEIDDEDLADRVATEGLAASLPWVALPLNANNAIKVAEYKYVLLSEGDRLTYCTLESADETELDNNWKTCLEAKYVMQGNVEGELETIKVSGMEWKAKSSLQFKVGPDTTQTLHDDKDSITLSLANSTADPIVLRPDAAHGPLSLKANYTVYSSIDTVSTVPSESTAEPFALKLFKKVSVQTGTDTNAPVVALNDFGSGIWTKLDHMPATDRVRLNVNIPEDEFGLVMMYYLAEDDQGKHICVTSESSVSLSIYNLNLPWWPDLTDGQLRFGVNCIKITGSGYIEIAGAERSDGTVIFSDVSLVKDINPALNFAAAEGQELSVALSMLKTLDPNNDFYYNTPIDNSVAIDLNKEADEYLDSPLTWYDHNNVCNKFVISEIDASYLKKGITIATTSKL